MSSEMPSGAARGSTPIPDADLLAELRRLADELGRTPSAAEMTELGAFAGRTYHNHFGSWTAACKLVGLEPNAPRAPIPDADLLAELTRLADELGRTPTMLEMDMHGAYAAKTYRDHFDSWVAACEAADLEPQKTGPLTDEELLSDLQHFAAEIGHSPSMSEMNRTGPHSASTYVERFDGWNAACEAAGLSVTPMGAQRIPTADLLDDLVAGAQVLGFPPRPCDIAAFGEHSVNVYRDRFGSLEAAHAAAGLIDADPDSDPDPDTEVATQRWFGDGS